MQDALGGFGAVHFLMHKCVAVDAPVAAAAVVGHEPPLQVFLQRQELLLRRERFGELQTQLRQVVVLDKTYSAGPHENNERSDQEEEHNQTTDTSTTASFLPPFEW